MNQDSFCLFIKWGIGKQFLFHFFYDSFASDSGSNSSKIPHRSGIAILRNRNRATSSTHPSSLWHVLLADCWGGNEISIPLIYITEMDSIKLTLSFLFLLKKSQITRTPKKATIETFTYPFHNQPRSMTYTKRDFLSSLNLSKRNRLSSLSPSHLFLEVESGQS